MLAVLLTLLSKLAESHVPLPKHPPLIVGVVNAKDVVLVTVKDVSCNLKQEGHGMCQEAGVAEGVPCLSNVEYVWQ